MSNLMLPLPAGKKASARAPETDGGKVSPARVANRKKPRSFSEPKPGRKKSFRQHLDQALGKGFPGIISPPSKEHVAQVDGKAVNAGMPGKGFPVGSRLAHSESRIPGAGREKAGTVPPAPGHKVVPTPARTSLEAMTGVPVLSPDTPATDKSAGTRVLPGTVTLQKPFDRIMIPGKRVKGEVPGQAIPKTPAPTARGPLLPKSVPEPVSASVKKSPSPSETVAQTTDAYGFDKRLEGSLGGKAEVPPVRLPRNDFPGPSGGELPETTASVAPSASGIAKGPSPNDSPSGFSKKEGKGGDEAGDLSRLFPQPAPIASGTAPAVPVPDRTAEPAKVPEFAEKIAETARAGGGMVTLKVHPPELGPVVVTVQVDPRSKAVDVRISVRDASVRSAIEGKGETLKRLLRDEGFSMHRLDISLGEPGTLSSGGVLSAGPPSQSGAGTSGTFNSQASPQDLSGGSTLFSGDSGQGSGGTRGNGSSAATDRRPENGPEGSGDEVSISGTGSAPTEHRGFHRIA